FVRAVAPGNGPADRGDAERDERAVDRDRVVAAGGRARSPARVRRELADEDAEQAYDQRRKDDRPETPPAARSLGGRGGAGARLTSFLPLRRHRRPAARAA